MRRIRPTLVVLLLLLSTPAAVWAMTPEELEQTPTLPRCQKEMVNLTPLFDRRDEGMTRERALAIAEGAGGAIISTRAVQIAYDFPKMPRDGTQLYTLWTCHALAHYVPVRPLKEIEAEMQACFSKPAWDRESCGPALYLKVIGLPADYQSRGKQVVVLPPPIPGNTPVSRAASAP